MEAANASAFQRNPVYIHKFAQASRVFCGKDIGRGENIEGAQGDIARRPDRDPDKPETGSKGNFLGIQRWTPPFAIRIVRCVHAGGPVGAAKVRRHPMLKTLTSLSIFEPLRKGLRHACLAVGAALLAACEPIGVSPLAGDGPTVDLSAPIPVALLVPRGSGAQGDDLIARNLENAARLAISDLNGVEIDLRVYGTAGSPTQAATAASQAVNDGAKIIIGPLRGEAANAASVAVAARGVNVLAFTNNTTIAGGNLFVMGATFENTANRLVNYAKRSGKDRFVVAHAQDVGGQLGKNAIQTAIARQGGQLAGVVDYPLSQEGVIAAVPRIKAVVDNSAATSVFLTAPSAAALPLFAQLLPEAGVSPETTQYIGLTRWDIPPQTLDLPGLQGGWFALPDPNRSAAFQRRYSGAYGGSPHPLASLAYDGIAAVGALAAKNRGRNPFSGAAITQGAGFQGATGVFRFRPDGTNQRGLAVATIRNRKVVVIDAAPSGFSGAGF